VSLEGDASASSDADADLGLAADEAAQPLAGKRILITRAPHQALELASRLRALGAIPILIPAIEIGPPASFAALDSALAQIDIIDLIVFTSANAVRAFDRRAQLLGLKPAPRGIAVVGPATARAVEAVGLRAEIMPATFTAESLAQILLPQAPGRHILLVLAEQAAPALRATLEAAGAHITVAPAYSNRIPEGSLEPVRALFAGRSTYPDAITFTSASTAMNLVALLEAAALSLPASITRASIGPVTSSALRELGLAPHVEAAQSTIPSLVAALAAHRCLGSEC